MWDISLVILLIYNMLLQSNFYKLKLQLFEGEHWWRDRMKLFYDGKIPYHKFIYI